MLTAAQRTALAAHIRASATQAVIDALAAGDNVGLTALYNAPSSFYVWRKAVTPAEYKAALVWTEIDALTAGQARIWEWITAGMTEAVDASDANVRQGISDAFTTNAPNTKAALLVIAKAQATLFESVFATGTGTQGTPGNLVVSGTLDRRELGAALRDNP